MDWKRCSNYVLVPLVLTALVMSAFSGIATPANAPEALGLEDSRLDHVLPQGWEAMIYEPPPDYTLQKPEVEVNGPGLFYVLVEPGVYPSITSYVDRYMADVAAEGYIPELHTEGWADEFEVKTLLETGYASGMVGAFLIGDIPTALYEIDNDFNEYGYTYFPIDLFYMDLDGTWVDNDTANGIFEDHIAGTGDLQPEIWVGRLYSSTVSIAGENETSMMQNYFDKNHEYRMGNLSLPNRALVYIDDDWSSWPSYYADPVGLRYSQRTDVLDVDATTAADYKQRLDGYSLTDVYVQNETTHIVTAAEEAAGVDITFFTGNSPLIDYTLYLNGSISEDGWMWLEEGFDYNIDVATGQIDTLWGDVVEGWVYHAYYNYSDIGYYGGYDWISVFVHSSWSDHYFYQDGGSTYVLVHNTQISAIDPIAHFYNLFCCSAGDFTQSSASGNLAGHYLFSDTHGLCALASTKTGSMLEFDDFYAPLGEGSSIGEAYLDWFVLNGETGGGSQFESRCWFYGMTIAGDPTLDTYDFIKPEPPTNMIVEIDGDDIGIVWDPSMTPDVSHYLIYRSTDPASFDFETPFHNTSFDIEPLACEFFDVSAAVTPETYFYIIRAVDLAFNEDNNTNMVIKYYKPLAAGEDWDLVSAPLIQQSTSIEDVLAGADWDYALWYDPADADDHWKTFETSRPSLINDLVDVDNAMGIWLRTSTADSLAFVGTPLESTDIQLKTGWNLVSYPSFTERTVSEALASITYDSIEGFDPAAPYSTIPLTGADMMGPGEGYWIKVSADCVWTVDW